MKRAQLHTYVQTLAHMFQCELFPKSKIAIKYVLQTVVSLYIIEINQQIPNMQLHSKTDHICHDFPVFCGSKYSLLTHLTLKNKYTAMFPLKDAW